MPIKLFTIIFTVSGLLNIAAAYAKNPQEIRYRCSTQDDGLVFCLDEKSAPLTGKRVLRSSDGIYISIENYRNGYLNGLSSYFDSNGQKKERLYYKNGIKNGMYKTYYPNRSIKVLANYKDGLLDGKLDIYYPDGKLAGRMTYKDGRLLRGFCYGIKKKEKISNETLKDFPENKINECDI